jgi:hypothetical protein
LEKWNPQRWYVGTKVLEKWNPQRWYVGTKVLEKWNTQRWYVGTKVLEKWNTQRWYVGTKVLEKSSASIFILKESNLLPNKDENSCSQDPLREGTSHRRATVTTQHKKITNSSHFHEHD